MVLVIEDLHWADVSTIDVLGHLAPRLSQVRLLVVVTYRQRELLVTHHPFTQLRGELIARGHLDEVPLSLLGLDAIRDYLRLVFGDEPMSADIAPLVFQRTEGNPLFMVEVCTVPSAAGTPIAHACPHRRGTRFAPWFDRQDAAGVGPRDAPAPLVSGGAGVPVRFRHPGTRERVRLPVRSRRGFETQTRYTRSFGSATRTNPQTALFRLSIDLRTSCIRTRCSKRLRLPGVSNGRG